MSRQIGAVLVQDRSIVATGYNGPARGVPHCGKERLKSDKYLQEWLNHQLDLEIIDESVCPRRVLGFMSGEGLEWCTAAHAERNTICNAARLGVSTLGTTLYMNDQVPCKDCIIELINAGIEEVVVTKLVPYDKHSDFILSHSKILVRQFMHV
jgi:dCMP deaminase